MAVEQIRIYGQGVPQDYKEAFAWFQKAAIQGHPNAQYLLGLMYRYGWGVPVDYAEAKEWMKIAAENGNPDAKKSLEELENFIDTE